jgi:hypothetical protein
VPIVRHHFRHYIGDIARQRPDRFSVQHPVVVRTERSHPSATCGNPSKVHSEGGPLADDLEYRRNETAGCSHSCRERVG